VSRFFAHLVWAERRTSHLLVLQQLDIQMAFGRPSGALDVAARLQQDWVPIGHPGTRQTKCQTHRLRD